MNVCNWREAAAAGVPRFGLDDQHTLLIAHLAEVELGRVEEGPRLDAGELVRLATDQRRKGGRGARLHPVLAPPRVGLGEPDGVHPGLVHHARRLEHLVERLHRELHHPDPKRRHVTAKPRTMRSRTR